MFQHIYDALEVYWGTWQSITLLIPYAFVGS